MLAAFAWLIVATLFVQVPNLLGIDRQQSGDLDIWAATKIAFITIPLTFVATAGFALYYGRAEQYFSYSAMVIYAHLAALAVGIAIQVGILKTRQTDALEIIGLLICMLGLVLSVFSKPILAWYRGD
jgi:Kef-type K+ transport system membrane component KefB